MMNLSDVAKVFNTQVFTDAYGVDTFNGQILPYSDSVRSGPSTRRRILEVAPDVTIPTEKTVTTGSDIYILAEGNPDFYNGSSIRIKHPILPVDTQYVFRTVGEILTGSGGTTGVYMAPSQIRREILEEQSEFVGRYELYFSPYYSVPTGIIFHSGTKYYRVREASRVDDIGFGVAEAVIVEDPISSVSVITKGTELNPTTDDYVSTTTTDVSIFEEYISLNFQHEALGYVRLSPGDKALSFLKSQVASIKPNDTVGDFLVKAVSDEGTAWTVHGRPI